MFSTSKLSALAAGLLISSVSAFTAAPASAQTANTGVRHTETVRQLIAAFQDDTGATITTNGNLNLDSRITIPAQGFANRAVELNAIATALNSTWRKVYVVTPATPSHPPVTMNDAKYFSDGQGRVTFNGQSLPAAAAIAAAAQADGASALVVGTLGSRTVSLQTESLTVPQAIAAVSAQTSTNWRLTYQITPRSSADEPMVTSAPTETIVPRYLHRVQNKEITDPTVRIPGYYRPVYVHVPANPVTYQSAGVVLYQTPADQGGIIPMMPQVIAPDGTGLISGGYNTGYNPYAYSGNVYNPYVANPYLSTGAQTFVDPITGQVTTVSPANAMGTTQPSTSQSLINSTPVRPFGTSTSPTVPQSATTSNTGTIVTK